MPKTKTTFTAQLSVKIGKTPVDIKVPLDFTQVSPGVSFDDYVQMVHDTAAQQLSELMENSTIKLAGKADLKKAYKAFLKSQIVS